MFYRKYGSIDEAKINICIFVPYACAINAVAFFRKFRQILQPVRIAGCQVAMPRRGKIRDE